jgi:uncharacterized coiled-coil protein SlyX
MKSKQIFTMTTPAGSERKYSTADGSTGTTICIGDVGYVSGNASVMHAIALEGSTDSENWQIVNIVDIQNVFLISVAVLGATSREHAADTALRTFNADLGGIGMCNTYDIHEAPAFALLRILNNQGRARFKSRITEKEIYNAYLQATAKPVEWKGVDVCSHSGVDSLVSDMVRYDTMREMQQSTTPAQLTADIMDGAETDAFDSIISQVQRMDALSNRILKAMDTAADKLKPTGVTKTDPFKKNGVVNIAQIFTLADGQTITIVYHNPDSTPSKLDPQDLVTSWKFLLNKRDVTVALQPQSGKDVNIFELAKRMMKIAEANSARFLRGQERKLQAEKALDELNKIEAEKKQEVLKLDAEIEALQAELDKDTADSLASEEHGTIGGGQQTKDEKSIKANNLTRDENGYILSKDGKPVKNRSICQRWITDYGLTGYVPKVIDGGYVLAPMDDHYFKENGQIIIGNPQYSFVVQKAVPKLLFEAHGRTFVVVENTTGVGGSRFETVEMISRSSVGVIAPGTDKTVFFFSSAMEAYRQARDTLKGFTQEKFNNSAMAKMPAPDLSTAILIAEGNAPQPQDIVANKIAEKENAQKEKNKQDMDMLRDENGKLNPWSDNPMERVKAMSEWSFDEKLQNQEELLRWLNRNANKPEEGPEFDAELARRRMSTIQETAGDSNSPDYLKANELLYTALQEKNKILTAGSDETAISVNKDKLEAVKTLLKENGVSVQDDTPPLATISRYSIKNPKPRTRKPIGSIRLTEQGNGIYALLFEQHGVGGEFSGDIKSIKNWLMTRMQPLGNAVSGAYAQWESIKASLELTAGDDVLRIKLPPEPADLSESDREAARERRAMLRANVKEANDLLSALTDDDLRDISNPLYAGLSPEDIRSNLEYKIKGTPDMRNSAIQSLNKIHQQLVEQKAVLESPTKETGENLSNDNGQVEAQMNQATDQDERWLDQIISGDEDLASLDMNDFAVVAEKYADDTASLMYAKLEQALNLVTAAKMEKAKAVQG